MPPIQRKDTTLGNSRNEHLLIKRCLFRTTAYRKNSLFLQAKQE
nr:MAG TPA: hypothetical protein [Caudoviricetes sp.]